MQAGGVATIRKKKGVTEEMTTANLFLRNPSTTQVMAREEEINHKTTTALMAVKTVEKNLPR